MFRRTERPFLGRRPAGSAVVVVMLMLMLVIVFTTAAGVVSRQNYTNAGHKERMQRAEFAYRAGLATALERLAEDDTWAPTEAAPMVEYLGAEEKDGFRLWLHGVNRDSSTPIVTPSGHSLLRGQAAVSVVALVDGAEVMEGFGGAEATSTLRMPEVEFQHNFFCPNPDLPLKLSPGPARFLSYNSSTGVVPFAGPPGAMVPAGNEKASLRSLSDVDLGQSRIHGRLVLPSTAEVTEASGEADAVERFDEPPLTPHFVRPDPDGPLLGVGSGSQQLAPGNYAILSTGDGAEIELERGGEYFFQEIYLGSRNKLRLVGSASDGPCVIYTHTFFAGDESMVNMPEAPDLPKPQDLQVYLTPEPSCEVLGVRLGDEARGAFVAAGHTLDLVMKPRSVLYGAVIGIKVDLGADSAIHFDEALLGEPMMGQPQWALINQGRR